MNELGDILEKDLTYISNNLQDEFSRLAGKKLLITGGAGFIGTNFIRHALAVRPNWYVINLDALTYAGNPANLEDLEPDRAERHRF